MKRFTISLMVIAVALVAALVISRSRTAGDENVAVAPAAYPVAEPKSDDLANADTVAMAEANGDESVRPTPEELKEAAEDAAVDEFDALTDKWMEPGGKTVSMAEVEEFTAALRKVPSDRRGECVQRALNLIPDAHVMLLMGILTDKSQNREIVELVFNDILNRDEDVKNPILREIFKDRTHPCWDDAAWILGETGATET